MHTKPYTGPGLEDTYAEKVAQALKLGWGTIEGHSYI